jgi:L-rhamnonate dehydratase
LGQILVAVDTDLGVTGYGVGGGGLSSIHVVQTVLRDLLLGRDPDQISQLWDAMYAATLPFGQKGLAIMAISGVDLALWDLRGRTQEKPIVELLGGKSAQPIPTYVTAWDDLEAATAAGFSAFKLHVSGSDSIDGVLESVGRARDIVGSECQLMIDAWMSWDVKTTVSLERQLREFNLTWIEEPLPADDINGYRLLRYSCLTPIAGGEHEFTAAGFRPLIDERLHQVLQPDVCWCGGLTELIKIYNAAQSAGLRVCPHRGSEIWALHAIAALDNNPLAESGRPWMTWVKGQPQIEAGTIQLTDRSGFGLEIDESQIATVSWSQ